MNKPAYTIQQVSWSQAEESLSQIRRKVFIEEQAVDESLEWDGEDAMAFHLLARDQQNRPIGCARMLRNGHIGRMAVAKSWRKQGVGSMLLKQMMKLATAHAIEVVKLDAQCHAIGFYQRHGFTVCSDTFLDAGIPHQTMICQLAPNPESKQQK